MRSKHRHLVSVSRSARYAIHALHCLAYCGRERFRLPEISICSGVPSAYLSKIMVGLRNAGFVDAKRGAQGGYALAAPPETIDLLSVIESVGAGDDAPESDTSPLLERILDDADAHVRQVLASTTIADLEDPPLEQPQVHDRKTCETVNPTRRST